MDKISTTAKISFSLGIILVVSLFLFLVLFRSTGGGYLAQIVSEPTVDDVVNEETASPIVQEVAVSSAGAYKIGGQELYAFRADKRWPVGSITKLMTALVADRLYLSEKPYELIEITDEMVRAVGDEGGFESGETIRADDLIKAMMLVSSNDAANALAIHYGEDKFVALMNETAKELGMINTTFADATGISTQNLSTVEDIRTLSEFLWKNYTYIFDISQRPSETIIERVSGTKWSLDNINPFVSRTDFLGGKAGGTSESEGNLVSIFDVPEREGEVIIIVFGSGDRIAETEKILNNL